MSTEGDTSTEPWTVGKSLIMSHARATALYNHDFRDSQKGQIGISLNGDYYEPWDSNEQRDHDAAERRMEFHIGWFANPIWYVLIPASHSAFIDFAFKSRTGLSRMHEKAVGRSATWFHGVGVRFTQGGGCGLLRDELLHFSIRPAP